MDFQKLPKSDFKWRDHMSSRQRKKQAHLKWPRWGPMNYIRLHLTQFSPWRILILLKSWRLRWTALGGLICWFYYFALIIHIQMNNQIQLQLNLIESQLLSLLVSKYRIYIIYHLLIINVHLHNLSKNNKLPNIDHVPRRVH